jgi:hypothetical protein
MFLDWRMHSLTNDYGKIDLNEGVNNLIKTVSCRKLSSVQISKEIFEK